MFGVNGTLNDSWSTENKFIMAKKKINKNNMYHEILKLCQYYGNIWKYMCCVKTFYRLI